MSDYHVSPDHSLICLTYLRNKLTDTLAKHPVTRPIISGTRPIVPSTQPIVPGTQPIVLGYHAKLTQIEGTEMATLSQPTRPEDPTMPYSGVPSADLQKHMGE
jgi:hypothetical protein